MGTPGGGGAAGAVAGVPSVTTAPPGAGGAVHPCSRRCGFSKRIPVLFPAYALIVGADKVNLAVACSTACHGSGSLRYARHRPSAKKASKKPSRKLSGTVLAGFRFQLHGQGVAIVSATLTPAGRKLLARRKDLIVEATITVTVGNGRSATYTGTVDVTRSTPTPRHKLAALLIRPVFRVG